MSVVVDFLLGRRLANREAAEWRIGAFEGVPAMGLDGMGWRLIVALPVLL